MAAILGHALRRQFATVGARNYATAGTAATAGEHSGGYKIWKRFSFFIAFPAVGLCMLNAYLKHQEEHHHARPEWVHYDYLCRREKRFPWGDGTKSLFHNPHANPLPSGYED